MSSMLCLVGLMAQYVDTTYDQQCAHSGKSIRFRRSSGASSRTVGLRFRIAAQLGGEIGRKNLYAEGHQIIVEIP